jgi:LacI family transcriptional regulator
VIPELSNLFCTTIISSIEDILRQNGYAVIVCDCRSDETLEQKAVEFLLSKKVDGILNMPVSESGHSLRAAAAAGTPVVLFDRILGTEDYSAVIIDNRNAASAAVEHLAAHGHRRIGLIYGGEHVFTFRERRQGYREAIEAAGISPDPVLECAVSPTLAGGYGGMKRLLEQAGDMTAVFASNYEMTLGAVIAANETGIRIPDALSFIGFDNLELSKVMTPKLTTVAQPMDEIAFSAANLILAELDGSGMERRTVIHKAHLVHGTSVSTI